MILTLMMVAKGVVLGLSIAAPVGPVGVLCIHRTLAGGRIRGIVSGMGAATADMVCGFAAGAGISTLLSRLTGYQSLLTIGGALFLCYLGLRAVQSRPAAVKQTATADAAGTLLKAYGSTLLLTISNPMTWLTITGGIAGWGSQAWVTGEGTGLWFVAGMFAGSAIWWVFLGFTVDKLRGHLSPIAITGINRVSGLMIIAFGVWSIVQVSV